MPSSTGAPATPTVHFSVINDETLEVSWDEPHTPVNYPVTSYYIEVTDIYQIWTPLLYGQLHPDTRSMNITQVEPNSCTNLVVEVWAENNIGNGTVGVIYGAFPASKLTLFHCLETLHQLHLTVRSGQEWYMHFQEM